MKKLAIALALACASLQSCTFAVRTLGNPEPKAFLELDPATATRDSVVIALGSPQGRGLRRVGEVEQQLLAFNSFEGFPASLAGSITFSRAVRVGIRLKN